MCITCAWPHLLLFQHQEPQQSYGWDCKMCCASCPRRLNSLSWGCFSYYLYLTYLFYSMDCNYVPQTVSFHTERRNIAASAMQEEHHSFKTYTRIKPLALLPPSFWPHSTRHILPRLTFNGKCQEPPNLASWWLTVAERQA